MTNARVLANHLADLLGREHAAMAEFLVALAEFDRRKAWLELGHSSLFYFLHRDLGLSKGAAHYRKTAAALVQRFPEIVEPLRDGRLCITSIVHLAKVLTPENRDHTLPKFFQRSRREAMAVAAALQPSKAAPHRDLVTASPPAPVPLRADDPTPSSAMTSACAVDSSSAIAMTASAAATASPALNPSKASSPLVQPAEPIVRSSTLAEGKPSARTEADLSSALALPLRRDSADPLTRELSRLHITVCRRFLEKLDAARAALSHVRPGASAEGILEAGLDLLLQRYARRRGLVLNPRRQRSTTTASQTLTAAVKRHVWTRDGGRCQWPLESGGVCGSTSRLEFDHVVPRALGGPSSAQNLRLLCRVHNDLAARRIFGDEWMSRYTPKGPERGGTTQAPARA